MIGIVFMEKFRDQYWGDWIFKYALISIPLALVLFVFLSLILGYLDTKLGFREEELRNLSKSNPVMMELLETTKEMNERLKIIEAKK
jgi:uncharacterized protein YacL